MEGKITVIGYYGKKNLGDDLFEVVFNLLEASSPNLQLQLMEPGSARNLDDDVTALVCGGGDIVTDYFMKCVIERKNEWEARVGRRLPLYAVSIGVSFPETIQDGRSHYLDLFDHIIFRSKSDCDLLAERYGNDRVSYLPDLVFALPRLVQESPNIKDLGRTKPVLLVCLAQAMISDGKNPFYDKLVTKMITCLDQVSEKYDIHFMDFNYNRKQIYECDRFLHEKVIKGMKTAQPNSIIEETDPLEVLKVFRDADVVLAMRFHAHVLAVATSTPLVSLSMTNKTENLMIDCGHEDYMVTMKKPLQGGHYPIDFDADLLVQLLVSDVPVPSCPEQLVNPQDYLAHALKGDVAKRPPMYLHPERLQTDTHKVLEVVAKKLCKEAGVTYDADTHLPQLQRAKTVSRFYQKLTRSVPDRSNTDLRDTIVSLIEIAITGGDCTDFQYGLQEQIWNLNLIDGIEWMLHRLATTEGLPGTNVDTAVNTLLSTDSSTKNSGAITSLSSVTVSPFSLVPFAMVDMDYVPKQCSSGVHRSGWKYVVDHMRSTFHQTDAPVILDTYLDKTFHWSRNISVELELIPYKKPWIGFMHHTPSSVYTDYNTQKLITDPLFIESLANCVAIVVMSEQLQLWVQDSLANAVPVYNICHPTMFVDNNFSLEKFFVNPRIVQIGGWLRDSYAIYVLKTTKLQKCALQGKGMENYFPRKEQCNLSLHVNNDVTGQVLESVSLGENTQSQNKYYAGLLQQIQVNEASVTILERLPDDEYDELLSSSVVFLKLEEVSACNTVIECVVRNTPLLVNRLPPLEELLGKDYPLFYSDIADAGRLADDTSKIVAAHLYLLRMDKTPLMIETFLSKFNQILANIK
jgi:polysaccharide pyruvyl transferase WcaK-like protein